MFSGCGTINRTNSQLGLSAGTVFFTFDDGPNAHKDTTARLLDVLKKHNIKAMFALLGKNVEKNAELAKRIHDEGHIIINHGYSDKWAVFMGVEEFKDNLKKGEDAIVNALGAPLQSRYYRPQGGFYTSEQKKIWEAENYILVPGSVRIYDAVKDQSSKNEVVKEVVSNVEAKNGGLILLHDSFDTWTRAQEHLQKDPNGSFNREWIPDAVDEIIILLKNKGFRLEENIENFDFVPKSKKMP
ncbi:MAG: polysaccharide deacetylase family protein [Spirochaetaceae bacterium]|nr:polysaccharide deacetylase family protein [Spirochaetaceae bacterium]